MVVMEQCTNCHRRPSVSDSGWPGWCGACINREREHLEKLADRIVREAYDK